MTPIPLLRSLSTLLLAAFLAWPVAASAAPVPLIETLRVSTASASQASANSGIARLLERPAEQTAQGSPGDRGPGDFAEPEDDSHQSAVLWRQGHWTVLGDEEDCSLDLSFVEEGIEGTFSSMSVTLHFGDTNARVAFADAKFTQIEADKEYPLSMVFLRDGAADTRWGTQSFTGFEDFQANALFADLSWDELHRDLIEATSLEILLTGELLAEYPLDGAGAAVSQLEQCLVSNGAPVAAIPAAER